MFQKHKVYKHENNVDVAFLVTDIEDGHQQEDGIYLRGYWMKVTAMGNCHFLASDSVTVRSSEKDKWVLYEYNFSLDNS